MAEKFTEPRSRNDFQVAIVCTLGLESDMVRSLLDIEWSLDSAGLTRAPEDSNTYTIGKMGQHNIIVVHMPGMGGSDASLTAINLKKSFPRIEAVFVVGICGAAPRDSTTQEEIILGDCIVSTAVIKYDFGRQYPEGFMRKRDLEDNLPRPGPAIRGFLAKLRSSQTIAPLQRRLHMHLKSLQQKKLLASYPGIYRDRLFQSGYPHFHRAPRWCTSCPGQRQICNNDCDAIGCEENALVERSRIKAAEISATEPLPRVHFGRYGTADTVMKSAVHRDELAKEDKILAFEMEAAGFWEIFPTMIIKSACDYADSHKNKEWQPYAAATATAGLRAVLEEWIGSDPYVDLRNELTPLVQNSAQSIHGTNAILQDTSCTREQAQNIWDQLRKAEESTNAQKRRALLDWISPIKYGIRHDKASAKIQAGTCMWFIESNKFLSWIQNSGETLFCYGLPGTGKTVLTSVAINHLVKKTNDKGVAYVYGYHQSRDIQRNKPLLSLILKQLVSQLPVIPEALHEEFGTSRNKGGSLSEASIKMYLGEVRQHFGRVYILVDALDEFDNDQLQRDEFLTVLRALQEQYSLNLFFTARPIETINFHFSPSESLEVLASGVDIRAYLEGEISNWPRLRRQLVGNIAYGHNDCDCIEITAQPKVEKEEFTFRRMGRDLETINQINRLHQTDSQDTPQMVQSLIEVMEASSTSHIMAEEHFRDEQMALRYLNRALNSNIRKSFLFVLKTQWAKGEMKKALLHAITGTITTIEKLSTSCTEGNIQSRTDHGLGEVWRRPSESKKLSSETADNFDHRESHSEVVKKELVEYVQTIIISSIALVADGSFLLANLHIGLLKRQRNIKDILAELERILKGTGDTNESFARAYDDTYEQYMGRIQQQPRRFREVAQKTFVWMKADIEEILDACAGLVSLNNDSNTLEFIHQTLMDYLIRKSLDVLPRVYLRSANRRIRCSYFDIISEIVCHRIVVASTFANPGVSSDGGRIHRSYYDEALAFLFFLIANFCIGPPPSQPGCSPNYPFIKVDYMDFRR